MGELRKFVTPLHLSSKREYLPRMINDKVHCMQVAKKYGTDYWDGDRRYGYGGYKYIPGRWKQVAEALINTYKLVDGSKVLDVGCGKGYLLHEMLLIEPGLNIKGFDISKEGIEDAKTDDEIDIEEPAEENVKETFGQNIPEDGEKSEKDFQEIDRLL